MPETGSSVQSMQRRDITRRYYGKFLLNCAMLYPLISIGLAAIFLMYLCYLAFIKKNLKANISTVVLPGLFFLVTWVVMFYFLLK